jgi:hypothetical protein
LETKTQKTKNKKMTKKAIIKNHLCFGYKEQFSENNTICCGCSIKEECKKKIQRRKRK